MFYDSSSRFDFMSDQICFFSPLINRLLLISRQTEIEKVVDTERGAQKQTTSNFFFFRLCVCFSLRYLMS